MSDFEQQQPVTQDDDFLALTEQALLDEEEISLIHGISLQIENACFAKIEIEDSRFENCTFQTCDFANAAFVDVIFESCDLSNSVFQNAYFKGCKFISCKCIGANFQDTIIKQNRF